MLKFAYQCKEALEELYLSIVSSPRCKFFVAIDGYIDFNLDIKDNTWNTLQYVSIGNSGHILGYLSASLDLKVGSVSRLSVVNFYKPSLTFSKDFYEFLNRLIHRYNKINFVVVVGNPAEAMYDRVMKKYNGRIVGTKKDDVNIDGILYDLKMYEILRKDIPSKALLCPSAELSETAL